MAAANSRGDAQATKPRLRHFPGLNGIRALSVLAIIAFHSGLSWIPGGYYGVDAFFVLSGFLITALLLAEWGASGSIDLRRFWGRRARRLLPALFLLVAVIGIVMASAPDVFSTTGAFESAFWTVFYGSNWFLVHAGVSYFSLSNQPLPWTHTWSLAIEEQFYLIWPLLFLGVLGFGTRRRTGRAKRRRRLHMLFFLACGGALASAALMGYLAPHGYNARAYYGTDTRAQALLIGAAISIGVTLWGKAVWRTRSLRLASGLAIAGVIGSGILWATTSEASTFAFRGGFLAASLAAGAVVLGCVVAPRSLVARCLELPPLPQLGRISYGMYLWYWPILLVTSGRLHWGPYELFALRVVLTVSIAALSYEFVEKPVRSGALRRWRMAAVAPFGAAAALLAVLASTFVPVGASALRGEQLHVAVAVQTTATTAPTRASATTPATTTPTTPTTTTATTPAAQPVSDQVSVESASKPTPAQHATPVGTPTASNSNSAPPPATKRPVKVLLVGDSLAGSLGVGLALEAQQYGVQLVNEGSPSCSVSMQGEVQVLWYTVSPGPPCDVGGNPDSLLATWRQWVDAYNPDVVVYLARGETYNQQVDGTWQNLGDAAFDSYVGSRFGSAIDVLGSRGAAVMFLTVPSFDSGVSGAGTPWTENDPARGALDNALMRSAAKAADGKAVVFDLGALVSPQGRYSPVVGSVNVRCGDGVHFSQSGGIFVGMQLAPELAAVGQSHARSSPGGAWPGPVPPSTPSWYSALPCQ